MPTRSKKEEAAPQFASYLDKEPTDKHNRLYTWLQENTGYVPETDEQAVAFMRGVQLTTLLHPAFQASDGNKAANQERISARAAAAEERAQRAEERKKAAEEKRAAKEARAAERAAAKEASADEPKAAPAKKAPAKKAPAAKAAATPKAGGVKPKPGGRHLAAVPAGGARPAAKKAAAGAKKAPF